METSFAAAERRLLSESSSRAAKQHGVRRGVASRRLTSDAALPTLAPPKKLLVRVVWHGMRHRLSVPHACTIRELKHAIAAKVLAPGSVEALTTCTAVVSAQSVEESDEWPLDARVLDAVGRKALVRFVTDHPLYDACRVQDDATALGLLREIDSVNNRVRRRIVAFALGRLHRLTPALGDAPQLLRARLAQRAVAHSRPALLRLAMFLRTRPSDFVDDDGASALQFACRAGMIRTARQLLRLNVVCPIDAELPVVGDVAEPLIATMSGGGGVPPMPGGMMPVVRLKLYAHASSQATSLMCICSRNTPPFISSSSSSPLVSSPGLLFLSPPPSSPSQRPCDGGADQRRSRTALQNVCALGSNVSADVARALLRRGADVHAGHARGDDTPLMLAARSDSAVLVQVLLSYGADAHLVNASGESALEVCAGGDGSPARALLLSAL